MAERREFLAGTAGLPIQDRLALILRRVCTLQRRCKFCDAELFFLQHRGGALAPYTAEGINHFENCPKYRRVDRARVAAQRSLLDSKSYPD